MNLCYTYVHSIFKFVFNGSLFEIVSCRRWMGDQPKRWCRYRQRGLTLQVAMICNRLKIHNKCFDGELASCFLIPLSSVDLKIAQQSTTAPFRFTPSVEKQEQFGPATTLHEAHYYYYYSIYCSIDSIRRPVAVAFFSALLPCLHDMPEPPKCTTSSVQVRRS
jgi:hypothetical protein